MEPKRNTIMIDVSLLILRLAVGLYFALAGLGKVKGEIENGFGSFMDQGFFKAVQPDWLPGWFVIPYGFALPWVELFTGAALVLGLFSRVSSALIWLMLLSFQIALIQFDPDQGLSPGPGPFHGNFVLLAAAFLLIWIDPGRVSLDRVLFGKGKPKKAK